jgi:hypothetical protein
MNRLIDFKINSLCDKDMSSGAVFTIISNEGKADKMLLASDLLEQRMNDIRMKNRQRVIA